MLCFGALVLFYLLVGLGTLLSVFEWNQGHGTLGCLILIGYVFMALFFWPALWAMKAFTWSL